MCGLCIRHSCRPFVTLRFLWLACASFAPAPAKLASGEARTGIRRRRQHAHHHESSVSAKGRRCVSLNSAEMKIGTIADQRGPMSLRKQPKFVLLSSNMTATYTAAE